MSIFMFIGTIVIGLAIIGLIADIVLIKMNGE